jgi:hypothetical protein
MCATPTVIYINLNMYVYIYIDTLCRKECEITNVYLPSGAECCMSKHRTEFK